MAKSLSAVELEVLEANLIAEWNLSGEAKPRKPRGSVAIAQALPPPPSPRPGFAIGRAVDPTTGETRLEVRIRTRDGDEFEKAQRLVSKARRAGAKVNMRVVPMPSVPVGRAQNAGAGAAVVAFFGERYHPIRIGCSIGHGDGSAGTLGAFVKLPDGTPGVISCCHVLALCGAAHTDDVMYQPGWPDEDPLLNPIGKLAKFAPFRPTAIKNLDAALAQLDLPGRGVVANIIPDCTNIRAEFRGKPLGSMLPMAELRTGSRVGKIGRTTGYSEGTVTAPNLRNQKIAFDGPRAGDYAFDGLIEIEWDEAARPGDSGALIFLLPELRPVAMHMAGTDPDGEEPLGYAMYLEQARSVYNFELL